MVIYKMNYNQNNNNLFEFMFNSACMVRFKTIWHGIFLQGFYRRIYLYAKKGHLWNHEILCDIHLHIKKKKEQSAKIPDMEVVNKDLKW